MQGLNLHFRTSKGLKTVFLSPRKTVEVPDSWQSKICDNLATKRMLRIKYVPDQPKPVVRTLTRKLKNKIK